MGSYLGRLVSGRLCQKSKNWPATSRNQATHNEDSSVSATYRCTAQAWNVSSIATVKSWLDQLEAEGYIERMSSTRGQTIRILKTA
ncbi:MAG: hypothetical protein L3J67_12065 [Hyphomicrobiaceae bacterium]|nr:hypothetical protein [Hyphomicrobiaceae bacterium]